VSTEIFSPADERTAVKAGKVDVPDGGRTAFRAAPLLRVMTLGDEHLIVVGQTQVWVSRGEQARVTVLVRALWRATEQTTSSAGDLGTHARPVTQWEPVTGHDRLPEVLEHVVHGLPQDLGRDVEERATGLAKQLAERSRNAVAELRVVRHGLELLLAQELRGGGTKALEFVLADLLELSTAASRARDEAREAHRAGLWTWRTDVAVYHAHRRLMDPSLPTRPGDRGGRRRSWLRVLDAAVRQCQHMERQLGEDLDVLYGLLNAASTIAVTRGSRAQETFNLVACVGGLVLGVPALVLSLYGADKILPLGSASTYAVFIPLALAGLLASLVAAWLPGRERNGKTKRFLVALGAVGLTLGLLALGGQLVPLGEGPESPAVPTSPVQSTPPPAPSVPPAPTVQP
jgi:hypothetical protein